MRLAQLAIYALIGAISGAQDLAAANISAFTTKENKEVIKIDGEIVEGDTGRFLELIRLANQSGRLVSGVRLNSMGGNLLEGAKLADAIRYAKIASVVTRGSTCASVCFLAFAAGTEKYAAYSAKIGVHGASDTTGSETTGSEAATVVMARALKELGVPAPILGKMVVTPPSEIVWLSPDELRSMGTVLVGKPEQTARAENDGAQPAPNQISPAMTEATGTAPPQGNAVAHAGEVLRVAKSGEETVIRRYFGWNKDCTFKVINVDITARPLHGNIRPKFGEHILASTDVVEGGAGACVGRSIRDIELHYTSKPGFIGEDGFSVRVSARSFADITEAYKIEVK